MIEAKIIADSINPFGDRLVTMLSRYPKFIHAEHCRHRSFSFSVSSSRAIPVSKNLEEVRNDNLRATPVWWGREQKGMESGEELSDEIHSSGRNCTEDGKFSCKEPLDIKSIRSQKREALDVWNYAAKAAHAAASDLAMIGVHKSIVNRILEPFLHVNVLTTGTTNGWMNFFGLRLDRAAQPEIRVLAECMWKEWNEHEPQKLEPGQWHLPFVDEIYQNEIFRIEPENSGSVALAKKISTACCAHLTYQSFETGRRMSISSCAALHDRLVTARHWSPLEHIATPDEAMVWPIEVIQLPDDCPPLPFFKHQYQAGNLGPGWIQYRKLMPNESIAPLPAEWKPST